MENWLHGKPPEWSIVIAARVLLRSIPVLEEEEESKTLSVFRAACAAWVAANSSRWQNDALLSKGIVNARIKPTGDRSTLGLAGYAISAAAFSSRGLYGSAWAAAAAVATAVAVAFSADMAVANSDRVGAANDIWRALADDARILESGTPPSDLAHHPLWPSGIPNLASQSWRRLIYELLRLNGDWGVWINWYGARLNGGAAPDAIDIARVTIADELWKQGPRAVNAEIARLISAHQQDRVERQNHVDDLPRPEYKIVLEDDSTIVIKFSNYAGVLRSFVNALKRSIDNAEFTAIVEAVASKDSLVIRLDPLVVPAAELADKIAELMEREQIAEPESLKPPDAPLPPPGPAARFAFTNGRFDIAPTGAWGDREAQANRYHARALELAAKLAERLSRTDAVPDVAGSVTALIDVLGASVADVQPDLLRLASRSIAAKARAYGHPAAQWEISAESVAAFFELVDVLVDLQSFVRTEIEAHEQAIRELDLTPEKAAEAKIALDLITEAILSAPEVISERAQTAFEAAVEVSDTATDSDVKVAVEGDRTLLTANLALAVARELGRAGESSTATQPVSVGDQQAAKLTVEGKPEKRQGRTRRAKTEPDERSWQDFADRILKRIHQKGPDRIADAALDALTGVIKHAPKTVAGLAAALTLWAISSPIATGGALASTIAWICYELRRKNKLSKLQDSAS